MPYPAKAIANEFIALAKEQGRGISPLKLQKLLYFANGWHLALRREPLINERIEAWEYGPVIADIYHQFKEFGSRQITDFAHYIDLENGQFLVRTPRLADYEHDPATLNFVRSLINRIWEQYAKFSPIALSEATHKAVTPWAEIYDRQRQKAIPDDLIREYFAGIIRKNEPATHPG